MLVANPFFRKSEKVEKILFFSAFGASCLLISLFFLIALSGNERMQSDTNIETSHESFFSAREGKD